MKPKKSPTIPLVLGGVGLSGLLGWTVWRHRTSEIARRFEAVPVGIDATELAERFPYELTSIPTGDSLPSLATFLRSSPRPLRPVGKIVFPDLRDVGGAVLELPFANGHVVRDEERESGPLPGFLAKVRPGTPLAELLSRIPAGVRARVRPGEEGHFSRANAATYRGFTGELKTVERHTAGFWEMLAFHLDDYTEWFQFTMANGKVVKKIYGMMEW